MDKHIPSHFANAPAGVDRTDCIENIVSNPAELIAFFSEDIQSGKEYPYDWQLEILHEFGKEYTGVQNIIDLQSANGAGKSKNIIAPCAVWSALFDDAVVVVTSASGSQLDAQTAKYIKNICS